MFKKLLIVFAVLAVAFAASVNILSQKAPELLRSAIERALDKAVEIRAIEYRFPGAFELQGFKIKEKDPFLGETAFYVESIRLDVSLLSLSRKMLIIDRIKVESADIIIRKIKGKLTHALSGAMRKKGESQGSSEKKEGAGPVQIPLKIHNFLFKKCNFKFIDYDAQQSGFVIALDQIDGNIEDIELPFSSRNTSYRLTARLPQGRDQKTAQVSLSGWTDFKTWDTDANLSAAGVYLPYFRPYYSQVTPAVIEDGYLDSRASLQIKQKNLDLNVDLEIINLLFQNYEGGDELFGLKADEVLSFLKDRSGRLKFQITAEWNLADRSIKTKDVIRKSIERSLKATVLGNVANILEKTIQKFGETGMGQPKDSLESKLKKIKDFFKV